MNSQKNAYANPLECAYVVTDHLRLWSETFSAPTKGWRIRPRTVSRLSTTSLLLYTKEQAVHTLTRTWMTRSNSWTLEYKS